MRVVIKVRFMMQEEAAQLWNDETLPGIDDGNQGNVYGKERGVSKGEHHLNR